MKNDINNIVTSPTTVTGSGAAFLEVVTTSLGYPGLGTAIVTIISSIFGRRIDAWLAKRRA